MKADARKIIVKPEELLFFISYILFLLFCIVNASFFATYIARFGIGVTIMCVFLLVVRELLYSKIGKHEIILLLLCLVIGLILLNHTNGFTMFPLPFFIYGARNVSFRKIAKVTITVSLLLLAIIIFCAKAGIITDYISYPNGRARDYIGFRYALFPSVLMFNITALIIYLDRKKKLWKYLALIFINAIIFAYTDSRLSFYLSVALIIFSYLHNKAPFIISKVKPLGVIMVLSFIICSVFSISITIGYNSENNIMRKADILLENRLSLGKNSLAEYPISLFGQDVEYIGSGLSVDGKKATKKYNYVDCLYLNMLEKYGIIFFVIYIVSTTYSLALLKERKEYILLIIMTVIAARSMIDDLSLYLHYNTFWLIIGNSIVLKNKKGEDEK